MALGKEVLILSEKLAEARLGLGLQEGADADKPIRSLEIQI